MKVHFIGNPSLCKVVEKGDYVTRVPGQVNCEQCIAIIRKG